MKLHVYGREAEERAAPQMAPRQRGKHLLYSENLTSSPAERLHEQPADETEEGRPPSPSLEGRKGKKKSSLSSSKAEQTTSWVNRRRASFRI